MTVSKIFTGIWNFAVLDTMAKNAKISAHKELQPYGSISVLSSKQALKCSSHFKLNHTEPKQTSANKIFSIQIQSLIQHWLEMCIQDHLMSALKTKYKLHPFSSKETFYTWFTAYSAVIVEPEYLTNSL